MLRSRYSSDPSRALLAKRRTFSSFVLATSFSNISKPFSSFNKRQYFSAVKDKENKVYAQEDYRKTGTYNKLGLDLLMPKLPNTDIAVCDPCSKAAELVQMTFRY